MGAGVESPSVRFPLGVRSPTRALVARPGAMVPDRGEAREAARVPSGRLAGRGRGAAHRVVIVAAVQCPRLVAAAGALQLGAMRRCGRLAALALVAACTESPPTATHDGSLVS